MGAAACGGDEALDFSECELLVCGEVAGFAGLAALRLQLGGDGGARRLEDGAEDEGRRLRGIVEPRGHRGGVVEVGEGVVEAVGFTQERGEGAVEFAFAAHGEEGSEVWCDEAGIAGLTALQQAGLAALAVSHLSACIGQADSTLRDGVVSYLNAAALALGFVCGQPLKAQLAGWVALPANG